MSPEDKVPITKNPECQLSKYRSTHILIKYIYFWEWHVHSLIVESISWRTDHGCDRYWPNHGRLVHIWDLVLNDIEQQTRSKAASYHGRDAEINMMDSLDERLDSWTSLTRRQVAVGGLWQRFCSHHGWLGKRRSILAPGKCRREDEERPHQMRWWLVSFALLVTRPASSVVDKRPD
jgi:hypothetical protein